MHEEGVQWADMNVMVTGATGFLGSHMVRELRARGATVTGVSRREVTGASEGLRWIRADLTDHAQAMHAIASCRPDYVFHLSSLADGRRDLSLVMPTIQAELVASVNVLIAAAEVGVRRLLLPGSLEEPEPGEAPTSPYAAAKACSRLYARMFHLLHDVPVVSTRIFMTYGPGQPQWKLIPSVALAFLRGEAPRVGSPDRSVDWVYVTDVIDGLIRSAEVEGLEGKSLDLGSGTLVTIRDLVEMLRELTNARVIPNYAATPERRFERVVRADLNETMQAIAWCPKVALREGLARTLGALRGEEASG